MANQVSYGGYLESVLSNAYVFTDCVLNDIILYTDYPHQSFLIGTDHEKMSALRVDSNIVHFNYNTYTNNAIGLGTSNFLHMNPSHKFTIMGKSNNSNSPSIGFYTEDSAYPVYQQWVNSHDSISFGLDAFYDGSNVISSSCNFNVFATKDDNALSLLTSYNVTPGNAIDLSQQLCLTSNGLFSFGNIYPTQKITITGPSNSKEGPHFITYTDQDDLPLSHVINLSHDSIIYGIDSYLDLENYNWISSDWKANYRIVKNSGKLTASVAYDAEPGTTIFEESWSPAISINSNSFVGLGTVDPTHRITIKGPDASVLGPHMAFYNMNNPGNPSMQLLNWTNDDISISFDTYWNLDKNIWTSSDPGANFRIQKENATLIFYSTCNIPTGYDIDPMEWASALSIGSNSFVSLGNSNPTHRLTIIGPSNDVKGPHSAFYVTDDPSYPVFQQYNARHGDINLAFDCYYNGENWLSSDTSANFIISKKNSNLIFFAGNSTNLGSSITTIPIMSMASNGETYFYKNVNFSSHVLPASNMQFDLGSPSRRWRDLYLSGSSINLQNVLLKKDTDSSGLVVVNGDSNSVTRIWAKEILLGDPDNVANNFTYLLYASNNGLQIKNLTSNILPQSFSQIKNLFITDSNVGIGLSNPSTTIHVIENFNNQIRFDNVRNNNGVLFGIEDCNVGGGGIIWNKSNAHLKFGTQNIERMRISRDGKLFIGSVDPSNALENQVEISTGGSNNAFVIYNNSNLKYGIWLNTSNTLAQIGAHDWTNNNPINLIIQPNESNVGIGTTTPQEKLHVLGSAFVTGQLLGNSSNDSNIPAFSFLEDKTSGIYSIYQGALGFVTESVERMQINEDGYVGIATSTPDAILDVAGDTIIRSNLRIYGQLNVYQNAVFESITVLSNTVNIYGQLNAYSNAYFASNVTIASNLLVQQDASLSNTVNIYGQLNAYSNAYFASNITIASNLLVQQATTLSNTTNIYGQLNTYSNAYFASNVTIGSNLLVQQGASLSNTVNIYGQLNAYSNAFFASNVTIGSNLLVQQGASLSNTVNIYGQLNAYSNAFFASNVTIASNLLVQQATTLSNTTNIYGQLNAYSNAYFASNVTIGSNLLVQQGASLSNTVNIYGQLNAYSNAFFASNVTIGSNLLVQQGASLSNTVNIYGQLNAYSNAYFASNVTVGGNLTITGNTTIVSSCNLTITDNIVQLNKDLTGAPPAILWTGFEFIRGSQSNQFIVFQESSSLMKIGPSNNLVAICTRDDTMSNGYAYFNNSLSKLQNRNITIADVTNLQTTLSNYLSLTGGTISGSLDITSNLTVQGDVAFTDNIIKINKDQTGTPASTLWSGLEIVRGSQSSQLIVFQESTGIMKVGVSNNLHAICTREDVMNNGYAYYNNSVNKIQNKDITISDVSNLQNTLNNMTVVTNSNLSGYLSTSGGTITGSLQVNGVLKSTSTGSVGIPYILSTGYFDLTDTAATIGFVEPGNPSTKGSMFHLGFLNGSNCSGDAMNWTRGRLVIRGCSLNTSNTTNTLINICCYNSNTGSNTVLTSMTCRDYGAPTGYTTNISPYFALSNNVAPYLGVQLASSNTTYRVGPTTILFSSD